MFTFMCMGKNVQSKNDSRSIARFAFKNPREEQNSLNFQHFIRMVKVRETTLTGRLEMLPTWPNALLAYKILLILYSHSPPLSDIFHYCSRLR